MKEKKRRIRWTNILFLLFLVVFLVSGGLLLRNRMRASREQAAYDQLAGQVQELRTVAELRGVEPDPESGILPQYEALWEQNPDLAGWIRLEDTPIDYPVMQTPQDEEYYLRRAFDRSDSVSGTPFLSAGYADGCGNAIIYGHNMDDGSMFAALLGYRDLSFWQEHRYIQFDTLTQEGRYEVLAAFYVDVALTDGGVVFPYYTYTDLRDLAVFNDYLSHVEALALYDTGVAAEPGDDLLTLSTCSYHVDDGRFVVVAKRVAW